MGEWDENETVHNLRQERYTMKYGLDANRSLTSSLNINIVMLVRMVRTIVKGCLRGLERWSSH